MQPIYVVFSINLIIWLGIFGFMISTDRKIKNLSDKLKRLENEKM